MRFLTASLVVAALGGAAFVEAAAAASTTDTNVVVGAFIVEVASPTSSGGLAKRQKSADGAIEAVLGRLARAPRVSAQARRRFRDRPEVFAGASIQVAASVTLEDIAAVEGVQNVWPVRKVPPPTPITRSDAIRGNGARSAVTAQQLLDLANPNNGALARRAITNDTFSPHVQGQVDVSQSKGYTGQGIKIGIIDTGVDWRNPILNYPGATPCFGAGCLVSFGTDFVGDAYSAGLATKPDNDPYTDCSEHGTHVLGIVAAQQNGFGFTGVAPGATLGMYRVFGCSGFSGEDIIIAALLRAYADGCNVVSASLGGPAGWLDAGASQAVVERLNRNGVVTTVSAGNDRAEGLFWPSSPAATTTGISVGSVDVASLPAYLATIAQRGPLPILTAKPIVAPSPLPVYVLSLDSTITNDGCQPLDSSLNLAGRVVLVQRGGCDFVDKLENIAATGARYALVYNSATGGEMPYFDTLGTQLTAVGSMRREDGLKLLDFYKANRRLRMSFTAGPLTNLANNTLSGGLLSDFSSFGPTNELVGSPTLAAPGGSILSTIPLSQGGVGVLSGTSMAAPYVAGCAALLLSARKSESLTPAQVRSLLATTANYAPTTVGGSNADSVVLQGSGLIQIDNAINAKTLITPHALSLNDTAYLRGTQTITLTNRNTFAVRYAVSHIAGVGLATYDGPADSVVLPSTNPQQMSSAVAASVSFSSTSLTIAAGATASFTVTIVPPALSAADAARLPVYSGFIQIAEVTRAPRGVTPSRYTVPYFGVAGRMFDLPILDSTDRYASQVQPGVSYPYIIGNDGAFVGPESHVVTKADGFNIVGRLAQGTRSLILDLVDAEIAFTPTITSNSGFQDRRRSSIPSSSPSLSAPNFSFSSNSSSTPSRRVRQRRQTPRTDALYSSIPIIGRIASQIHVTRSQALTGSPQPFSGFTFSFFGLYQPNPKSGAQTAVVNGKGYRVLLRALKITGDPRYEADWESWLSPPFSFSG